VDWAPFSKALVDQHAPQGEKICLVLANRTTHTNASLSEAFAPPEATRIADQ
jgi:hypothetical protein